MKTLGDFFWAVWFFGYFPVFGILSLIAVNDTELWIGLVAWTLTVAALGGLTTLIRDWFFR